MFLYVPAGSGLIPYMSHTFSFLPYGKCFSSAYIHPHPEEGCFYSKFFVFSFPLLCSRGRGENLTFFKKNFYLFFLYLSTSRRKAILQWKTELFLMDFFNTLLRAGHSPLSLQCSGCIPPVQEEFYRTLPPVPQLS